VDVVQLLKVLRRRWIEVTLVMAVALGVAWLSTRVAPPGPPIRTYEASAVLLSSTEVTSFGTGTAVYNIQTIAALATVGEVPERVAGVLQFQGDPFDLAQQVQATGSPETGILRITATSTDPEEATTLANEFATQLVAFLGERTSATVTDQGKDLRERINTLKGEIAEFTQQIGTDPTGDEVLVAERDSRINAVTSLTALLQQLLTQSATGPGLVKIQDAVPIEVAGQVTFDVRSTGARLVLAALLGLVASVGIVLLLEKLDRRIRTREQAERSLDLPVLSEIPVVRKWTKARANIAVATEPKSAVADSLRLLAAAVTRRPPTPPQVILVTSPGPGDGKSTVVANLAATFAEVGKRVLVLSCDLRKPRIHSLFGVPNMSGLSEVLSNPADGNGSMLGRSKWRTPLSKVMLVPSGSVPAKPGELLSSDNMRRVLEEARGLADIVLVDTAPVLAAGDSAHLFPLVDAVLVIVRADKTLTTSAERASELLRRLKAPVVGALLNAASEAGLPRDYYEYYEATPDDQRRRGFGAVPALARLRGGR
jgi:capsular exopolysaccharide synthesis family protein